MIFFAQYFYFKFRKKEAKSWTQTVAVAARDPYLYVQTIQHVCAVLPDNLDMSYPQSLLAIMNFK